MIKLLSAGGAYFYSEECTINQWASGNGRFRLYNREIDGNWNSAKRIG